MAAPQRKVMVMMSVSLDGFMAGPDQDISWHHVDAELLQFVNDHLSTMGAFLEGRVTYQLMDDFWPTADEDPAASAQTKQFARIWRDMPKFVYSRTLDVAGSNATIVRDVVVAEIEALKAEPGGDLSLGGADLAATFMRHDLIDEYRLYVNPVVIGAGKPMFPADLRLDLELAETRQFGNGVVMLRYVREGG
jgi:dihydrofolate reductase